MFGVLIAKSLMERTLKKQLIVTREIRSTTKPITLQNLKRARDILEQIVVVVFTL